MTMEDLKSKADLMMKAIKLDFENTDLKRELEQYQEQNKAQTLQIIQLLQEIEQLKAKLEGKGDE
jgi:hypothetical protein